MSIFHPRLPGILVEGLWSLCWGFYKTWQSQCIQSASGFGSSWCVLTSCLVSAPLANRQPYTIDSKPLSHKLHACSGFSRSALIWDPSRLGLSQNGQLLGTAQNPPPPNNTPRTRLILNPPTHLLLPVCWNHDGVRYFMRTDSWRCVKNGFAVLVQLCMRGFLVALDRR